MMRFLNFATLLLLCSYTATQAGNLSSDLQRDLKSSAPDDKLHVFIKVRDRDNGRGLRTALSEAAPTRAARYQKAADYLENAHRSAQEALLGRLKALKLKGKSSDIHPYWIVNVIEAKVAASELEALCVHEDVEYIQSVPEVYLIEPEDGTPESPTRSPALIEDNLTYIKADQAWAAGYTGEGRVICSFDTGIRGTHHALENSWKGRDGDSAAAWFDPVYEQKAPHTQPFSVNHGTHVMGIMVGHDDVTGDTVGVAPGAEWISAAVVDVGATVLLRAFEWAADPDGNPNTVDDVPDVINHSWGFEQAIWAVGCEDIFFDAIDNVEALGIVNIFAAGNTGPNPSSVANPANRDLDSLDCFAVGNINHATDTVYLSSSRGPSLCNSRTKPNVLAPGVSIRSATGGTDVSYGFLTGTSMAAPHVSGLVALLRQKNPNATPDEIKQAILTATDTRTNFGVLPNNSYGWGLVDCMAALNALPGVGTSTNVRVYDFDHPDIVPGVLNSGAVIVQCLGAPVANVYGKITSTDPQVAITQDSVFFGSMATGDTLRSDNEIAFTVSADVLPGDILTVDFLIAGDDGLSISTQLYFVVGPRLVKSVVTHNTGQIRFSLSNFGVFGFSPSSFFAVGPGVGFIFDNGPTDELFEAGLMIGTGFSRVSSGVHSYVGEADDDFAVLPGGNLQFVSPGRAAYQQTFCKFTDSRADNPLGLEITQESFADTGRNSDFVILRYILKNTNSVNVNNVHVGLYFDWEVGGFDEPNVGGWEAAEEICWLAEYNGGLPRQYRGIKLLKGSLATAYVDAGPQLTWIPAWGGNGFTMDEKYGALSRGINPKPVWRTTPGELFHVVAAGPRNYSPGTVDTVTFALLANASLDGLKDVARRADSLVATDVEDEIPDVLPTGFTLYQNYPNPFNPTTTIGFDLPVASEYTLSIYNALGQLVHREKDYSRAGRVAVDWDASGLATGIYLYKVEAERFSATRKMLLLK
jgi:subtilisin family serine protease